MFVQRLQGIAQQISLCGKVRETGRIIHQPVVPLGVENHSRGSCIAKCLNGLIRVVVAPQSFPPFGKRGLLSFMRPFALDDEIGAPDTGCRVGNEPRHHEKLGSVIPGGPLELQFGMGVRWKRRPR